MLPAHRRLSAVAAALAIPLALAVLASGASAAKKSKTERFLHPNFTAYNVRSIGLIPVAILIPVDHRQAEEEPADLVRRYVERAVRPSGYKFLDERTLQAAAKAGDAGESLAAMENSWHKSGELDTMALKALGAAKVADAVLATMITTWNRVTIDPSVTGQSITEVGLLLSLYSTRTGELLWRDTYLEKGEGPYNNPGNTNVIGVQGSNLGNTARTSTALDPPTYQEIVTRVSNKIGKTFPPAPKVVPQPVPAGDAPAPPPPPDAASGPAAKPGS
jgi:hypothetical protein